MLEGEHTRTDPHLCPEGVPRAERVDKTVNDLLPLGLKCSKHAVPDDKHASCT